MFILVLNNVCVKCIVLYLAILQCTYTGWKLTLAIADHTEHPWSPETKSQDNFNLDIQSTDIFLLNCNFFSGIQHTSTCRTM